MRARNKRNITIGILCCMLVFMGIGYAALQQVLTINGTGNINGSWKIEITDISPEEINEGKSISTNIEDSKTEGSFTANLKKPTDAVIYTVTVENKGTIDAVLERVTPEDYAQGDIKYTTTGKEDCKNLDAGSSCNFTIKVEYLDTGLGQVPTPKGTEVKQEFTIKYVQEGANVNTPGGSGGGEVDDSPAITVDSNGLVTGYNKEKLTNSEGYVVIPATTESGEEIVSIDANSFAEYNVSAAYIYNENTDEETMAIVIYDEENFDAIKSILLEMLQGGIEGSSNSFILRKDIKPSKLFKSENNNPKLKQLSDEEEMMFPIYTQTQFEALLKEMETTGTLEIEYEYLYLDPVTKEMAGGSQIEKLDLTKAIHLKRIEESAFQYSPLKEIKFSDSIEEIGSYAFEGTSIGNIKLPNSLISIGDGAFSYNQLIGTLIIPKSIKMIGSNVFSSNQINKVNFSEGLTTIGYYAFANNQINEELVIPNTVTSIGDGAFTNNQINKVNLSESLKTIGNYAFGCNQIAGELIIPNSVTVIEANAFANNQISGTLTLPTNIETIKYYTFNSNQISKLIIPKNLITIEYNAFSNNIITNLEFDQNSKLVTIGVEAFANNKITDLILPKTLKNLGNNTGWSYSGVFSNNPLNMLDIDVENIPAYAFSNLPLKYITIGSNVKQIGNSSFENQNIVELTILNSDININTNAFYDSTISTLNIDMPTIPSGVFSYKSIQNLNLGSNVITIGERAFEKNEISELTIPEGVTTIGNHAFINNYIIDLTIPNSVKTLGNSVFYNGYDGTNLLTTLNIDMETIPSGIFNGKSIVNLTLGSNVTTIEEQSFNGNKISNLTIPNSVTTIGEYAFYGNKISKLTIPNSVTTIGFNAFSEVTTMTIDMENIPNSRFKDKSIQNLTIGENVKTIGYDAFYGNQISKITIPSNVIRIESDAFSRNPLSDRSSVTIEYNDVNLATRFNSNWRYIGFPYWKTIGCYRIDENINSEIVGYSDAITCPKELAIPSELDGIIITTIGEHAFDSMEITKLTLSSNIRTIGRYAFNDNKITELIIPSNVTTIEYGAFNDNQINLLTFEDTAERPSQLTTIGEYAFLNNQIKNLKLPNSVTTIESGAFNGNDIVSLILSNNIITIGEMAFRDNQISGEVIIPSSITRIEAFVFLDNPNLTKIIIKKADSTGMTLSTNWNAKDDSRPPKTYHEVVWDPNYVG